MPPPVPLSGLDELIRDHGFSPIDLSALTSIHIGAVASTVLSSEPSRLPGLMSCQQWSYFDHVPARFGHSPCLDDAFRCLVTAARSMLVPDRARPSQKMVLSQYGTALQSLQSAVNDASQRYSPEVLCATGLLALFEVRCVPVPNIPSRHAWRTPFQYVCRHW